MPPKTQNQDPDIQFVDEPHSDIQFVDAENKPVSGANTDENPGFLSSLGHEFMRRFGTENDPEAQAMLKSFGYLGGLTTDALAEFISRVGDKGGLGSEEWENAIQGEGKPFTEHLQNKFGMGKLSSNAIGLPVSVIADPIAGLFNTGNAGLAGLAKMAEGKVGTEVPTIMEALKNAHPIDAITQTASDAASKVSKGVQPVGAALQELGRRIFRSPFRAADSAVATKYKGKGIDPHAFTEALWNEGDPLVGGMSKSNPTIGDEITNLRRQTGSRIGERIKEAGGTDVVDLAPDLKANAKKAMEESLPEPALSAVQEEGLKLLPPEQQGPAKLKMVEGLKKEQAKGDPLEWLMSLISSNDPQTRAKGIDLLAKSAPELAGVVRGQARHLFNADDRGQAIQFYNNLIYDLSQGPRTLDSLQDLKVAKQNAAAKNMQMGTNTYAKNAMHNVKKSAEAEMADALGEHIDNIVDQHFDMHGVNDADKALYSVLRRGENPAWQAITKAENRPGMSAIDWMLSGFSLANPTHGVPVLAGKVAHKIAQSPRGATGVGRALNRAGKSNVWDNALRKLMLQSGLQPKGENQ